MLQLFKPTFVLLNLSKFTYRQLAACVLLAAFLAQIFSKPFIVVDYYTNKSKYAKNCENKAKPSMHCNGKCQMMKKLQQEEKKDQGNPERKAENKQETIGSTKSFFAIVPDSYWAIIKTKKTLPPSQGKSTDRSFAIFHPPQA